MAKLRTNEHEVQVSAPYRFRRNGGGGFDIYEDFTNPTLPVTLSGLEFVPDGLQPVDSPATGPLTADFTLPISGLTGLTITTFYKRMSYGAMGITGAAGNNRLMIRTAPQQVSGQRFYGGALCMSATSGGRVVTNGGDLCPTVPAVSPTIPNEALDTGDLLSYTLTITPGSLDYYTDKDGFISESSAAAFANINRVRLMLHNSCSCSVGSSFAGMFTARFIGFGITLP